MSENKGYHAHVYYDAATKPAAEKLRAALLGKFKVEAGAFSDAPIGPHPVSQFNVMFETPEFEQVAKIRPYVELGFRHLVFHAPGPDQPRFLKLYAKEVLPRLRKAFG